MCTQITEVIDYLNVGCGLCRLGGVGGVGGCALTGAYTRTGARGRRCPSTSPAGNGAIIGCMCFVMLVSFQGMSVGVTVVIGGRGWAVVVWGSTLWAVDRGCLLLLLWPVVLWMSLVVCTGMGGGTLVGMGWVLWVTDGGWWLLLL